MSSLATPVTAYGVSAWRRRVANPVGCGVACLGDRPPNPRALQGAAPTGAPPVRAHAEPAAARPACPRALGRPRRWHSPASPRVTPAGSQASMAPAVAPGQGNGATATSWGLARDARGARARLFQAPTHHSPGVCTPVRRRAMLGMSTPFSARSPATPSVARGRPTGANDPLIPVRWGRVGASVLWPHGPRPPAGPSGAPATGVASPRLTSCDTSSRSRRRSCRSRALAGPSAGVRTGCRRGLPRSSRTSSGAMLGAVRRLRGGCRPWREVALDTCRWSPSVTRDARHIPAVSPQRLPRGGPWRGRGRSTTSGTPLLPRCPRRNAPSSTRSVRRTRALFPRSAAACGLRGMRIVGEPLARFPPDGERRTT